MQGNMNVKKTFVQLLCVCVCVCIYMCVCVRACVWYLFRTVHDLHFSAETVHCMTKIISDITEAPWVRPKFGKEVDRRIKEVRHSLKQGGTVFDSRSVVYTQTDTRHIPRTPFINSHISKNSRGTFCTLHWSHVCAVCGRAVRLYTR